MNEGSDRRSNVRWHSDPGHAWLQVPYQLLVDAGVRNAITQYSRVDKSTPWMAYLEEDFDARVFLQACEEQCIDIKIIGTTTYNEQCHIRDLPPYPFTNREVVEEHRERLKAKGW